MNAASTASIRVLRHPTMIRRDETLVTTVVGAAPRNSCRDVACRYVGM